MSLYFFYFYKILQIIIDAYKCEIYLTIMKKTQNKKRKLYFDKNVKRNYIIFIFAPFVITVPIISVFCTSLILVYKTARFDIK